MLTWKKTTNTLLSASIPHTWRILEPFNANAFLPVFKCRDHQKQSRKLIRLRWHVFKFTTLERHQFRYTHTYKLAKWTIPYVVCGPQYKLSEFYFMVLNFKNGWNFESLQQLLQSVLYSRMYFIRRYECMVMEHEIMLIWKLKTKKNTNSFSQNTFHLFRWFSNLTFKS